MSSTAHHCANKHNKLSLSKCQTILAQGLCKNVPGQCESTCNGCDITITTHVAATLLTVAVGPSTPSSTVIKSTKSVTQTSSTNIKGGESANIFTTTPVFYPSFVTFRSTSISKEECENLSDAQKKSIASALDERIQTQLSLNNSPAGFSYEDVTCGSVKVSTPLDIGIAGKLLKLLRSASFWVPTRDFGELNFGMEIAGSVLELIDPSVSNEQCEKVIQSSPTFAQDLVSTIATSVSRAIGKNMNGFDIEREIVELGQVVCTSSILVRLTIHKTVKQALENFLGDNEKRIRGTALNKQFSFVMILTLETLPVTTVRSTSAEITIPAIPTTNNGESSTLLQLGNDGDGTNSITIAVIVCVVVLLLAIIIAVGVGYCYVKRRKCACCLMLCPVMQCS